MNIGRKRAKQIFREMNPGNWWQVSKKVTLQYGCEVAIAIADLLNVEKMLEEKGQLASDDWFFQSIEDVANHVGLSKKIQYKVYAKLRVIKFIEQVNKGCPRRRWFRIDYDVLFNYFTGAEDD